MIILPACMCVYHVHACGGQKWELHSLDLVVSGHMGAGTELRSPLRAANALNC